MSNTETVAAAISDPGEVGRAEHNRGDRLIIALSNIAAWLFPLLMIAICAQVVLRAMGHNQAWLDDAQWWMYGAAVLIGIAYAVTTNSHVRVDIFYDTFERAKRIRIDIFALVWLFLPFIILCWDVTLGYALSSIAANEGSDSPNGLHKLWILKSFMNLSFIVIAYAIWSAYLRLLNMLTRPALWKQLLFAFPATAYAANLAIYYAIYSVLFLTRAEDMTGRDVGRLPIFGELEIGPHEIRYTVLMGLIAAILMIAIARLFAKKDT